MDQLNANFQTPWRLNSSSIIRKLDIKILEWPDPSVFLVTDGFFTKKKTEIGSQNHTIALTIQDCP